MDPTPLQFAKMAIDHVTTNPINITSPTIFVTGADTQPRFRQVLKLDEGILAAIATPEDPPVDPNQAAKSHGKRGRRKKFKNSRKLISRTMANPNTKRDRVRNTSRKSNKNATTATASSGSDRILRSGAGTQSDSKKVSRKSRKWRKRNEKKRIESKTVLESPIASENKKGDEAVGGLVEAMEGFGIGGNEEVKEKMEIDMHGLEMKMAVLDVMEDDDGEIM
ncbi:hypothetical protein HOY80DRAFT_1108099 [Tuber brumale]|nr:hypothetical protein HOY80DRAFT_1108099 [Tuber brumale]